MLAVLRAHKSRSLAIGAIAAFAVFFIACNRTDPPTSTPVPTPTTVTGTPTPNADELIKARILEIFTGQVAAIKQGDWAAVYQTCSPAFKAGRTLEVFTRTNVRNFAQAGYTAEGFEARNVDPSIRAADRVRVKWDAYQNGEYVRTEEVGQVYVRVQGRWYDEGAWCR